MLLAHVTVPGRNDNALTRQALQRSAAHGGGTGPSFLRTLLMCHSSALPGDCQTHRSFETHIHIQKMEARAQRSPRADCGACPCRGWTARSLGRPVTGGRIQILGGHQQRQVKGPARVRAEGQRAATGSSPMEPLLLARPVAGTEETTTSQGYSSCLG